MATPYPGNVPGSSDEIVSFAAPPVAEVVTSLRFTPMPLELFTSLGDLRESAWRSEFPRFEQQGPYDMPTEEFAAPGVQRATFQFGLQTVPPLPRIWLVAESGNELLQLQADWFAANWRGQVVPGDDPGNDSYPRWPTRRLAFANHWDTLSAWLSEHGHNAVPTQCEITYINHIRPIPGLWERHAEIGHVLPMVQVPVPAETVPEQLTWRAQYEIPADADLPQARLHLSVTPGFAGPGPEPSPIVVLELTVRGAPSPNGDVLGVLDRGRRIIVNTFLDITSEAARENWGQR